MINLVKVLRPRTPAAKKKLVILAFIFIFFGIGVAGFALSKLSGENPIVEMPGMGRVIGICSYRTPILWTTMIIDIIVFAVGFLIGFALAMGGKPAEKIIKFLFRNSTY